MATALPLSICVVTATTDLHRAKRCVESWGDIFTCTVLNGGGLPGTKYLGTVPAFRQGVDTALEHADHFDLIACLHDDLEILDPTWATRVSNYFAANPAVGLAGFGGAIGLGDEDLYQTPYRPKQLARKGFRSNMIDAEVHGIRSLLSERVACLDGFSQIGRREFWEGLAADGVQQPQPWSLLESLGMVHHFYDGALGCLAARNGWETWYLPIACKHYGGATAVGDPGYQTWAASQVAGGDWGFWKEAHRIGYDSFRDVLPLRV